MNLETLASRIFAIENSLVCAVVESIREKLLTTGSCVVPGLGSFYVGRTTHSPEVKSVCLAPVIAFQPEHALLKVIDEGELNANFKGGN